MEKINFMLIKNITCKFINKYSKNKISKIKCKRFLNKFSKLALMSKLNLQI